MQYELSPLVCTADLDTAKLHIGTMLLVQWEQNICAWTPIFYLTAKLDYFEYMRMPLSLFPIWTRNSTT